MKPTIHVIGMDDHPYPEHLPVLLQKIKHDGIFSGGKRHLEIAGKFLPENSTWIEVSIPISGVIDRYRRVIHEHKNIVVFVSGDPFFYGFATTIKRNMPEVALEVYPAFNSLQQFAHRLQIPYQDMHAVSVTGRPWHELDRALLEHRPLIGILTDRVHTPDAIAKRMLEYRMDRYYTLSVAEHIGNPEEERIVHNRTAIEIAEMHFKNPNCVLLFRSETDTNYRPAMGIPEKEFVLLDNRLKMITKAPVRIIDLSVLELHRSSSFWDIGACTGSVSVEARRQYPHLKIDAFEIREACQEIIDQNARRFSAPGINIHIGDFIEAAIDPASKVDAVFIGGHGGKLEEIVEKIKKHLDPFSGKIVFNSVSEASHALFCKSIEASDMVINMEMDLTIDQHNPIKILKATCKEYGQKET